MAFWRLARSSFTLVVIAIQWRVYFAFHSQTCTFLHHDSELSTKLMSPEKIASVLRTHPTITNNNNKNNNNAEGKRRMRSSASRLYGSKGMDNVVLIECGSGCCHGRDSTKAAIRACKNAIEFNSVKVSTVIPGGYDALKVHVHVGVPEPKSVDLGKLVDEVFPYGTVLPVVVEEGGLRASNTANMPGTGDLPKEDMTLAVACVSVGYDSTTSLHDEN